MTRAMNPMVEERSDSMLELRIRQLGEALVLADGPAMRLVLWQQMRQLIGERSARQVSRMERERGLS